MPTNRKRRTHGQREAYRGLTDEIERSLMYGRGYLQQPSLDVLKAAWREHGDEILAAWIEDHPPGTRPFGWWLFVGVPKYGERKTTRAWLREHEAYRKDHQKYNILDTHYWPPCQEPEHRYLFRHGEITVGEYNAAEAISTFDADLVEYDAIMADVSLNPPIPDTPVALCDVDTLPPLEKDYVTWV
jgi:hypothetical protein